MNRRGFFSTLLPAAAAFAILPSALTYERIWKPTKSIYETDGFEYTVIFHRDMPLSTRNFLRIWRFVRNEIHGSLFVPEQTQKIIEETC
jgi:hypothetical protein